MRFGLPLHGCYIILINIGLPAVWILPCGLCLAVLVTAEIKDELSDPLVSHGLVMHSVAGAEAFLL